RHPGGTGQHGEHATRRAGSAEQVHGVSSPVTSWTVTTTHRLQARAERPVRRRAQPAPGSPAGPGPGHRRPRPGEPAPPVLGCAMNEPEVLVASCAKPHRADLERRSVEVAGEGHDQAIGLVPVDPVATSDDVDRPPDLVAAAGRADLALLERELTACYVPG